MIRSSLPRLLHPLFFSFCGLSILPFLIGSNAFPGLFIDCCLSAQESGAANAPDQDPVIRDLEWVGGTITDSIITPVNQRLTPVGKYIPLPGMRPQVIAISPDGTFAVTSGKTNKLVVFRPDSGEILQQVELPSEDLRSPSSAPAANNLKPDTKAIASFTGLVFTPDGRSILMSNVQGSVKAFQVDEAGIVSPSHSIPLPDAVAPKRKQEKIGRAHV